MGINKPNISESAESKEAENFKLKLDIIFNFNLRSWLWIVLANVVDKMRRFFCMQKEIVNGGENVQVCTCIMHITRNAGPLVLKIKSNQNIFYSKKFEKFALENIDKWRSLVKDWVILGDIMLSTLKLLLVIGLAKQKGS